MGKGRARRRKQRKRRSKQDVISLPPPQQPPVMDAVVARAEGMAIPLDESDDPWIEAADSQAEDLALSRQARRKAQRDQAKARKRRGHLVSASQCNAQPEIMQDACAAIQEPDAEDRRPAADTPAPSEQHPQRGSNATLSPSEWMENQLIILRAKEAAAHNDAPVAALEHHPLPGDQPQIDVSEICELLTVAEPGHQADQEFAASSGLQVSAGLEKLTADAQDDITPLTRDRALADPNAKLLTKLRLWIMRMIEPRDKPAVSAETSYPAEQLREVQHDLAEIQRRIDAMLGSAAQTGRASQ